MTRINLVQVSELTDKHLLAEYKEITRPFNEVLKRMQKYGEDKALHNCDIPCQYVLGEGHERFFFNKLGWLSQRYNNLFMELYKRGFNINQTQFRNIDNSIKASLQGTKFWGDYDPTPEEIYLNMARLCIRSNLDKVIEEI